MKQYSNIKIKMGGQPIDTVADIKIKISCQLYVKRLKANN